MPQTSSGWTQPPVPWVPAYFPRGKWSGYEVDLSPPSAARIKNVWSHTSALPICLHSGHGQLYCLLQVACRSHVLKGRAWGSLYSVATADADIGCSCVDRISGYIYMYVTEHNRMSRLMTLCVMEQHWVLLQHFQLDLVTVDVIRHGAVCHSHFEPLYHCG